MQTLSAKQHLLHEAGSLLARLDHLQPFSLTMPMVRAASVSAEAFDAIEQFIGKQHAILRMDLLNFMRALATGDSPPSEAQKAFATLKIKYNQILSEIDIFADVLNQRSEHDTGVWMGGMDALASDALQLPKIFYAPPPVICYLDRGHGAAIRRARTRLPGGKPNPVAIIRVPRERMVGCGIGASLIHEAGHQGSALLEVVESMLPVLRGLGKKDNPLGPWMFWERWISEIVPDFWSVAKIGVGATLGLMNVVSLPRAFMFRISPDVHPFPYIRVKLSCAMGKGLYPHPQWDKLARLWDDLYPRVGLPPLKNEIIDLLETGIHGFVSLLLHHRPPLLKGLSLQDILADATRYPSRLAVYHDKAISNPRLLKALSPTLFFAVLGQAQVDGRIKPGQDGQMLSHMLKEWALKASRCTNNIAQPSAFLQSGHRNLNVSAA